MVLTQTTAMWSVAESNMARSQVTVATAQVWPDEKAYWLTENWRCDPAGGVRRVQRIAVLRGDEIAVYEEDKGAWDMDVDTPFQVPSFWEYKVAELQEIALHAHEGKPPTDPDDRLDLIAVWAVELDERRMRRDHRSTFGPHFRKERP